MILYIHIYIYIFDMILNIHPLHNIISYHIKSYHIIWIFDSKKSDTLHQTHLDSKPSPVVHINSHSLGVYSKGFFQYLYGNKNEISMELQTQKIIRSHPTSDKYLLSACGDVDLENEMSYMQDKTTKSGRMRNILM